MPGTIYVKRFDLSGQVHSVFFYKILCKNGRVTVGSGGNPGELASAGSVPEA